MYYKTQIKDLSGNYIIDSQGKKLQTAGNKFCQVGDTVWTDGKIIFGHTPLRSTPLLPNVESGIPVVADALLDDKNVTCGYFKTSGIFKKKKIAEDDWTTNAKTLYKHGHDKKVIDAEIIFNSDEKEIGLYTVSATNDGVYFSLCGEDDISSYITVKKNDTFIENFRLKNILEEKNKFDRFNSETEQSETVSANAFDKFQEIFSDSSITPIYNLSAQLVAFKINPYVKTEFIVGSRSVANLNPMQPYSHGTYSREEFQANTFLWESTDTALTQDPHLKNSLLMFWEHCVGCEMNNFEVWSWKYNEPTTDTAIFTDTTVADFEAEYLTQFKNGEVVELIEEKFSYPKIKNLSIETNEHDDEMNKIFFGFDFNLSELRHDENGFISSYNYVPSVDINGVPSPPVGDVTTYAIGWTAFFVGGEVDGEKIVSTCPIGTAGEIDFVQPRDYVKNNEIPNPVMTYQKMDFGDAFVIDSDFIHYRFFAYEKISDEIKNIFNKGEVYFFILNDANGKEHKVWLLRDNFSEKNFSTVSDQKISAENFSDFYFPIQDGYTAKWRFDSEFQNLGIFDSFSEIYHAIPPYEKKFFYFENLPNLSICKLKNGHLLGFHNQNLYKIYGNNFEKVGEGLKNFRLREMKNLKGAT
ncbi:MAG: hypothetical protein IK062_03295 [Selenomonadaceae bacterium]|nr:hypothetical protein [Selenomonadaceae bacterium]